MSVRRNRNKTSRSLGSGTQPKPGARPGRRMKVSRQGRKQSARSDRPEDGIAASKERLQKVLAAAGIGSRRQCEELILAGRVEVDRSVVTELGTRVDSSSQQIRVDGVALLKPKRCYYAVHKPQGVICTNSDPSGRVRVIDLLPKRQDTRLFIVGRLDLNSEGLLLLTNDGELANRLTHPRYGIKKVYRVEVAGHPTREDLKQLQSGVHLSDGLAKVFNVRIKGRRKKSTILEMVLKEGRNREIRRVLARVGHKVLRLVRTAVGPIRLEKLPVGECRPLSRQEVKMLKDFVVVGDQKNK